MKSPHFLLKLKKQACSKIARVVKPEFHLVLRSIFSSKTDVRTEDSLLRNAVSWTAVVAGRLHMRWRSHDSCHAETGDERYALCSEQDIPAWAEASRSLIWNIENFKSYVCVNAAMPLYGKLTDCFFRNTSSSYVESKLASCACGLRMTCRKLFTLSLTDP
jgi:hypothetical protein